jgi:hypothetical protein
MTNLYAILDKVAEEYGPPFPSKNDAVAIRQTQQLLQTVSSPVDYILVRIAQMDMETGKITQQNEYQEVDWIYTKEVTNGEGV